MKRILLAFAVSSVLGLAQAPIGPFVIPTANGGLGGAPTVTAGCLLYGVTTTTAPSFRCTNPAQLAWNAATGHLTGTGSGGGGGGGTGTVTSVAGPSWLTWNTATTTPTAVPTTGQTSHQVIGTCGSATTFGPCTLLPTDMPTEVMELISLPTLAGIAHIAAFTTHATVSLVTFADQAPLAAASVPCNLTGSPATQTACNGASLLALIGAPHASNTPQKFFGTTAPGNVNSNLPGDLYSDTTNHNEYWCNATSGSSTPACTSVTTNGWTLLNGGGGGGSPAGFVQTRTSAFLMTLTLSAASVNVRFGTNPVQAIVSGGTVTLGASSCAAGGKVWESVTPNGTLQLDANTNVTLANVTPAGFTSVSNTATATPDGNLPLFELKCGNSAVDEWDSAGTYIIDLTAIYSMSNVSGGTFVVPTISITGTTSLDIDPARLQGTDTNLLTSGTIAGTAATLCTDANGGATTSGCSTAGAPALSTITAAAGTNTIANGDNPQVWNWHQTTNSSVGMTFGETTAATGSGTYVGKFVTLAGSTATPLWIVNSLTGSQALPTLLLTPTWNTSGTATALKLNVTNTASNAASLLMDLQVGAASQFSINESGDVRSAGAFYPGTTVVVPHYVYNTGNNYVLSSSGLWLGSTAYLKWASAANAYSGTFDLALSHLAAGALGVGNGTGGDFSATLQSGVASADPGCTTTANLGKLWFDITTTTTALKVCMNVAGSVGWVTK